MYGCKAWTCPQCGRLLVERGGHGPGRRVRCATPVGLASSYVWHVTAVSFVLVVFIALLTYNHQRRGAWLLFLLLLIPILRLALRAFTPPWFTYAKQGHKPAFLVCYLTMLLIEYFYLFVGLGWIQILLGASPAEKLENLEMLSILLAWFLPQFLITPRADFVDVLGVVATNALFYSVPLLICWKTVRVFLNRSRVTQIGDQRNG